MYQIFKENVHYLLTSMSKEQRLVYHFTTYEYKCRQTHTKQSQSNSKYVYGVGMIRTLQHFELKLLISLRWCHGMMILGVSIINHPMVSQVAV